MSNYQTEMVGSFDPYVKGNCGTCKHRYRIEYRSGKQFSYCTLHASNRTGNGLMKVKCSEGCHLHQPGQCQTAYG